MPAVTSQKKGNDGSDFQYRMTVDNKYKKGARYRKVLSQLTNSLALYALVSSLLCAALLARPVVEDDAEPWWQTYTSASSHMQNITLAEAVPLFVLLLSALSSLVGMLAVQGSNPRHFQIQSLVSAIAFCLAFWPILSLAPLTAMKAEYASADASGDYKWFTVMILLSLQDVLGLFCNAGVTYYAASLAFVIDPKKKER